MVTADSGSPMTWNLPVSHTRSSTDASNIDAAIRRALSRILRATRTAAVGAEPERRLVGIAVHYLDVRRRDTDLLGDHLRERRLVSLTLRLARHAKHRRTRGVHPEFGAVGHAESHDVHVLARSRTDR